MIADLLPVVGAAGGGLLGFLGGLFQSRYSAEGRYNARVDKRLADLEQAVEECRERDHHIGVLTLGLKLLVPEVHRHDQANPVLLHICSIMSALPVDDQFDDLLAELNKVPFKRKFHAKDR